MIIGFEITIILVKCQQILVDAFFFFREKYDVRKFNILRVVQMTTLLDQTAGFILKF